MNNIVVKNIKIKKIQKFWRYYKINIWLNKFNKLKLTQENLAINFNEFCKLMRKKNILLCTKILVMRLSNINNGKIPISPRILLTSFLIKNYSDEVFGKKEDRHPADVDIYNWSIKIIKELKDSKDYKKLCMYLRNYGIIFDQWKKIDNNNSVEKIITAYYYRQKHIHILEQTDNIEDEIKQKSINEIKNQQNSLLINLKLINPNFDIEYLKQNYESLFNSIQEGWKNTVNKITNTMKLAYHNYLIENIEQGNMEPIFKLLKEIRIKLLVITPTSIKDTINNELADDIIMESLINMDNWNISLKNIIILIVNTILKLDAPINDDDNKKWKLSILTNLTRERNKILPQILIEIEEKIDNIYELIKKLAKKK